MKTITEKLFKQKNKSYANVNRVRTFVRSAQKCNVQLIELNINKQKCAKMCKNVH